MVYRDALRVKITDKEYTEEDAVDDELPDGGPHKDLLVRVVVNLPRRPHPAHARAEAVMEQMLMEQVLHGTVGAFQTIFNLGQTDGRKKIFCSGRSFTKCVFHLFHSSQPSPSKKEGRQSTKPYVLYLNELTGRLNKKSIEMAIFLVMRFPEDHRPEAKTKDGLKSDICLPNI